MLEVKVMELSDRSTESFEEALRNVSNEVSKKVNNLKSFYIKEAKTKVNNNHIVEYCVKAEVSYAILKI